MAKSVYTGTVGAMVKVMRADSKYLGAADLEQGKPICVLIESVLCLDDEEVAGKQQKGRRFAFSMKATNGQPLAKELLINRTNLAMVRELYGDNVAEWAGKPLWLHRTTCDAFGQKNVACVRVMRRTDMPKAGNAQQRSQVAKTEETPIELSPWDRYEACLSAAADERQVEAVYDAAFGPESTEQWTDQQRTDAVAAKEARKDGIARKKGGA